jgi:hypothetical protein
MTPGAWGGHSRGQSEPKGSVAYDTGARLIESRHAKAWAPMGQCQRAKMGGIGIKSVAKVWGGKKGGAGHA